VTRLVVDEGDRQAMQADHWLAVDELEALLLELAQGRADVAHRVGHVVKTATPLEEASEIGIRVLGLEQLDVPLATMEERDPGVRVVRDAVEGEPQFW